MSNVITIVIFSQVGIDITITIIIVIIMIINTVMIHNHRNCHHHNLSHLFPIVLRQTKIKYGSVGGGSTSAFFRVSCNIHIFVIIIIIIVIDHNRENIPVFLLSSR